MCRLRRLGGALLLVGSAAAMMATAALAQGDDRIAEIREQREQLARDAAEVATQVDALIADDEALIAALEDLDGYIGLQQTRIGAAEAAIVAAEAEADAARAEAGWLVDEIDSIRERLRERAVAAYVQPSVDTFDQLASNTLNDGAVRMFLLDLAIGNELELADELRTAEAQLEVARRQAVARAEEADRERQAQQQRLADLEEAPFRGGGTAGRDPVPHRGVGVEVSGDRRARRGAGAGDLPHRGGDPAQGGRTTAPGGGGPPRPRSRPSAAPMRPSTGPFELVAWPADGEKTSGFGPRVHPIFGTVRQHNGIDLGGNTGDRVRAARSGEVILAGERSGFGNTIVLYHGLGYSTLYAPSLQDRGLGGPAGDQRRPPSGPSAPPAGRPALTCTSSCASTAGRWTPRRSCREAAHMGAARRR